MTSGRWAALFVAVTVVAVTRPSHAQSAGDGFLFHAPVFSLGVRGGFDRASAGSDVFTFVTKQLTLNRRDFSSATFGTDLAIPVSRSNDIVFDAGLTSVSRRSEFRDWVDQNNLPIAQTTSLRRVPLTLGVRHYLSPRGRSIGRFAWIPAVRTTYIGLGAGLMNYRFRQVGDFVDFQTLKILPDEFTSKAWTPVVHALAGAEFSLGRFIMVTGEARYTWARGPMGQDYDHFNRIDLSGVSVTTGLSFRQ
jgi:hypothetical protein